MASESRKRAWTKYNQSKKRKLVLARYNVSDKRKATSERYRDKHKEKCNKWSREWYYKNAQHVYERQSAWRKTKRGKELTRISAARYVAKNKHKRLAKDAINNAIKAGRLIKQPCVQCGSVKSQGHHPDYSKPLEVIWLCRKHHHETHRRYK